MDFYNNYNTLNLLLRSQKVHYLKQYRFDAVLFSCPIGAKPW